MVLKDEKKVVYADNMVVYRNFGCQGRKSFFFAVMSNAKIEKTDFGAIIRVPDEIRQSPIKLVNEVNNLIDEIKVSKVTRVLYEINEPTTKLNGAQLVQIANTLEQKLSPDLKIAVYSAQYNEHLTSYFIENLISSKKIPTKYFSDFTQALVWLKV